MMKLQHEELPEESATLGHMKKISESKALPAKNRARKTLLKRAASAAALCVAVFAGVGWIRGDTAAPVGLVDRVRSNRSASFAIDRRTYAREDVRRLPIGVFDSGMGGLTVLNAILHLDEFDNRTHEPGHDGVPDFQDERFVYFGDQANMPYGNYPSAGREDFLRELIVEDGLFLLGRRYWPSPDARAPLNDKPPVKAVVIACNTATAYGLEDLKTAFESWRVPVVLVGVVEAGANGAVSAVKQRGGDATVAILSTVGTARSGAYPRTIERLAREQNVPVPRVIQRGSLGLAGAIEGDPSFVRAGGAATGGAASAYKGPAMANADAPIDSALQQQYGFDFSGITGDRSNPASWHLNSIENYVRYDVASMLEAYRRDGSGPAINTVVLGCTHYPFERARIAAALERLRNFRDSRGAQPYARLVAPNIEFVDPSQLTARELYVSLKSKNRLSEHDRPGLLTENIFFISKPNMGVQGVVLSGDGAFDSGYKYGRRAGNFNQDTVKRVPLRLNDIGSSMQALLRGSTPTVWESLQAFQNSPWMNASATVSAESSVRSRSAVRSVHAPAAAAGAAR